MTAQPGLFDDWQPTARPDTSDTGQRKTRKPGAPKSARYTRRPVGTRLTRVLCDDCTDDIHARGVAVAPYPRAARWVRTAPDEAARNICDMHKIERAETER